MIERGSKKIEATGEDLFRGLIHAVGDYTAPQNQATDKGKMRKDAASEAALRFAHELNKLPSDQQQEAYKAVYGLLETDTNLSNHVSAFLSQAGEENPKKN